MKFQTFTEQMNVKLAEASLRTGVEYLKQHKAGVTSKLKPDGSEWNGRIEIEGSDDFIVVNTDHWEEDCKIFVGYVNKKNHHVLSVDMIAANDYCIKSSVCEYDFENADQTLVGAVRAIALAALEIIEKTAQDPQAFNSIGRIRKTIHLL